ncbi:MAG: efflux RND transporter periplasmic adaptor subunit [Deltaproteobacteria bacterium]|nr:efflux RND transporter periplasmic adaptor subunit [Deltaproteobacteria bacterium]
MKRYLWIMVILALAGAVIGYRELSSGIRKKPQARTGVTREIPVKLAPVTRGPIAYVLSTSGDVLPLMQVDVVSRVSGYVERIHFEIGDRVAVGQVVAAVDPKELRHRVEEDEAALKVAEATLREKETQLLHTEKQVERARLLRQKDFISSQELDEAETRAQTARAQKELAQAQLAQKGASLAQSRYQLALTRVVAPFSGVVIRRLVDPGAYVSSSTPILTLAVPDPLKVVVNIPEKDVNLARVGMSAKLEVDAFAGRVFDGRIARLNSALDPTSRTLMAEIHVPNGQLLLKPGMFARVALVLGEQKDSLLVPAEAVVEEDGKDFLYTVADGKAVRRGVSRGWSQNSLVAIGKGIEEGEKIVVAGQQRLKPGMKVRVLEEKGSQ